jgi:hypothetical protein
MEKVKGTTYYRDARSKAFINSRDARDKFLRERSERERINIIENDVTDIKKMMTQILNKLNK